MRWITLIALLSLSFGCSTPTVIVIPGTRSVAVESTATRMPQCRYSRVSISHAESAALSRSDLALNAKVSRMIGNEFRRRGASVTENPGDAYWSIMVLAAEDSSYHDRFVFSATVALRETRESNEAAFTALESPERATQRPVLYTGLGFGPDFELAETVARFVHNADMALLPVAQSLCEQEGREIIRDVEAELATPRPTPF